MKHGLKFSFVLTGFVSVFFVLQSLHAQGVPSVPRLDMGPTAAVGAKAGAKTEAEVEETEPSEAAAPGTVSKKKASRSGVSNPAAVRYQKAQEAYKKAVQNVRELQKQYVKLETDEEEREEIGEKLQKYADFLTKLHPKLMDYAEEAWNEAPSRDPEMLRVIVEVLEVRLAMEEYERASKILEGLFAQNVQDILPDLYDAAGETAFMLNQFEKAGKYFAEAEAKNVLSERCKAFQKDLVYYRTAWAKESVLRERDKTAGDLPRVELETTKGAIVLELYENEAPNTVANFIYLAEKGFYDGLYFELVVPGLFAESGRSMETLDGGPGYAIRDEFDEKSMRTHYRGTVSMANAGPNTAGSRFFLCFTPMREMDGKFVVFGRVVKGMDVLSQLQRIDPANPDPMAEPDQIVNVRVIRKRDHKYRPKVLKIVTEEEKAEAEAAEKAAKSKKKKGAKSRTAY
ncbi:MAG: peptidylprolyl isomerase [Thermoguttaceae bacterium]|nr:peptidylprolyl isomerase [Thermoguttaceae bacterium]